MIEETHLSYSGETSQLVTTASALAEELGNSIQNLGEVANTASRIPISDDDGG